MAVLARHVGVESVDNSIRQRTLVWTNLPMYEAADRYGTCPHGRSRLKGLRDRVDLSLRRDLHLDEDDTRRNRSSYVGPHFGRTCLLVSSPRSGRVVQAHEPNIDFPLHVSPLLGLAELADKLLEQLAGCRRVLEPCCSPSS